MKEIHIHTTMADGVASVVLDHPPVNVLTRAMLAELRSALDRLAADRELRVLVLAAAGKHFSAGADVAEHMPPVYRDMIPEFVDTVAALAAFPLPTIAAVQGRCLGGGFELVQAVDLVVAAEGAAFGQPEIKLGVFPPAGCVLLPGMGLGGLAADVLYTGDPVDAAAALQAGLVRQVVPADRLEAAAAELAGRIACHSAAALRLTKQCVREALTTQKQALEHAGRLYSANMMATEDAVAGLTAFLQKRQPAWRHR
jgi:cyclohexa-1,5-dienecarbonyl-CoA hydratase